MFVQDMGPRSADLTARHLCFLTTAGAPHSHFLLTAFCNCPRAGPFMTHHLADMRADGQRLVTGLTTAQQLCLAVLACLYVIITYTFSLRWRARSVLHCLHSLPILPHVMITHTVHAHLPKVCCYFACLQSLTILPHVMITHAVHARLPTGCFYSACLHLFTILPHAMTIQTVHTSLSSECCYAACLLGAHMTAMQMFSACQVLHHVLQLLQHGLFHG